ncbi:hypothetical protein RJE46_05220 [Cedecea neteri]|uniref:phage baseplate protein n=1 Tax=Cedecea neteri TaxID=158822 RepID=UPI0028929C33|nr:hypothetical protein [Cedecea neteri]WNJ80641.1 hypothetical protein RJE46_05220 [Cedecea neteri]
MNITSALLWAKSLGSAFLAQQVILDESHSDSIEIASHPVEFGANISDHFWRKPSELTMNCVFSGGGWLDFSNIKEPAFHWDGTQQNIYKNLLQLQNQGEPISVITSKRSYQNMLLKQIGVSVNNETSNVLKCTLTFAEVIISYTEALPAAPKANMKEGISTSAVASGGTKTTMPMGEAHINVLPLPGARASVH